MGTFTAEKRNGCSRLTQGERANHILEAAIDLFARKGFQGTKTKEIAEAAGVNEALIFRDFQTKENLYCAILQYASRRVNTERWIEELKPYAERRDDEGLLSRLALTFLETVGGERTLFRLMLYSALEQHELARKFREHQIEPLERFLEEYIRSRQGEGAFGDANAHDLARSFLSMCQYRVVRRVLFGEEPPADADAARTFTELFLNGVRRDEPAVG